VVFVSFRWRFLSFGYKSSQQEHSFNFSIGITSVLHLMRRTFLESAKVPNNEIGIRQAVLQLFLTSGHRIRVNVV